VFRPSSQWRKFYEISHPFNSYLLCSRGCHSHGLYAQPDGNARADADHGGCGDDGGNGCGDDGGNHSSNGSD
jgi:hypothetical protein